MDISVLILQIITIIISVSTLIVNTVINISQTRKKHFLEITTAQRIAVFNENRKNQSAMFALCMPEAILENKARNNDFKTELAEKYARLLYSYKQIYDDEKDIIVCARKLVSAAFTFCDDCSTQNKTALTNALTEFYKLTSIYDASDWTFLKKQSIGKELGSDDFDKIIDQMKGRFDGISNVEII